MCKVCLFDIGNTNTRCVVYENGQLNLLFSKNTSDLNYKDLPDNLPIAVSSVVPYASERIYRDDILFISTKLDTGIDFSLVNSSQVGADRVANLVALSVYSKQLPAAIIDCGTAITLEVLNEKKQFFGEVIAPGRMLQRKALNDYTSLLPLVNFQKDIVNCSFGRNTDDSIICGTDYGIIGMCKEFISLTKEKLKTDKIEFFVTGGDSEILLKNISELKKLPKDFTTLGILEIWKRCNR